MFIGYNPILLIPQLLFISARPHASAVSLHRLHLVEGYHSWL